MIEILEFHQPWTKDNLLGTNEGSMMLEHFSCNTSTVLIHIVSKEKVKSLHS